VDLKNRLLSTPILGFLDFIKPFEVHIDASDFAIGGVFMQDGHSIAFENKKLYMLNYNGQLMKKSCMSLCATWKHGNTIVHMDNVSLQYFKT